MAMASPVYEKERTALLFTDTYNTSSDMPRREFARMA
jgi:hypothetical protein